MSNASIVTIGGNSVKIGIAIACHVTDLPLLRYCLNSIRKLQPQPFKVSVNINEGQELKAVRERLFNELYAKGCDVVLSCDVDFYLFSHILTHVHADKITSFAWLEKRLLPNIITLAIQLIYPRSWTGCYSVPREIWQRDIQPYWDGTDGSVKQLVNGNNVFVKRPQYYNLRAWRPETTKPFLERMGILKKIRWMMIRLAS